MCGIGVMWGEGANKLEILKTMLSQITHRGNSLYEIEEAGRCALGANRLEIIDRSNGQQPKKNEDGSILAVFNGEIFNYKELKNGLIPKGHKFETDCDTEILVHLYEEYEEKMLEKIDSEMFAFAIYDAKRDSLFVARDRWGVKPLYWAVDDRNMVYFASEIKALAGLEQIKIVKFFPPGHYFKDGKLVRYYKHDEKFRQISEADATTKLSSLIDEAVKKRVDTDLPVGVFLSGGLDSTAMLATAKKFNSNIVAIIAGNKNSEDIQVARRYCEGAGIKYVIKEPPSEKEMFKILEEIIYITESFEPNVVRQSAISYFISKAAKELGLRIVLCGEGADELFLGYPEFKDMGKRKIYEMQNSFLRYLNRTQFQRVDRTSMHFTIEVRVPFFDGKIVEFAGQLPLNLKIKEVDGKKIEKYILRKAMEDRLPDYICNRKKAVLSEGAGYKGNEKGGLFEELAAAKIMDEEFGRLQREFAGWKLATKEEAFYFRIFRKFGFDKAKFNQKRVVANRASSIVKAAQSKEDGLFNIITSKDFCRFKPKNCGGIKKIIKQSIQKKKPVEIFMLWGIGRKGEIGNAEIEALGILDELRKRAHMVHPQGLRFTIVVADNHAKLNLIKKANIYGYDSYAAHFERYVQSRGYRTTRLSEITENSHQENRKTDELLGEIENSRIWPYLLAGAERYYDGNDKKEGAKLYVRQRLAEKPLLEQRFKEFLFLTYNGPAYDVFAPDLPTLYAVPNRKRTNEKPWFVQNNGGTAV